MAKAKKTATKTQAAKKSSAKARPGLGKGLEKQRERRSRGGYEGIERDPVDVIKTRQQQEYTNGHGCLSTGLPFLKHHSFRRP